MTPTTRRTANRHPEHAAVIRSILDSTAMHHPGTPVVVLCGPRSVETMFYPSPGNPKWTSNNGKVCFDSELAANAAAAALAALPGIDRVVSYRCPRGGHWHHVAAARRAWTTFITVEKIAAAARRARGAA